MNTPDVTEQPKAPPPVAWSDLLAELVEEKKIQESKRDELDQENQWYHWHDGVAFGLHVAIEHLRTCSANSMFGQTGPSYCATCGDRPDLFEEILAMAQSARTAAARLKPVDPNRASVLRQTGRDPAAPAPEPAAGKIDMSKVIHALRSAAK